MFFCENHDYSGYGYEYDDDADDDDDDDDDVKAMTNAKKDKYII